MKGSTALMMQKLQKCIFFKINVFRNAFQREAKKIEGCNQSEQDKIVFTELYNTFFRFNLSFSNAELHRFLWSLLAGNTLYNQSKRCVSQIYVHLINIMPKNVTGYVPTNVIMQISER